MKISDLFLLLAATLAGGTSVQAHVTLEHPQAAVDSFYKAVFRVPHGCEGAATLKLRVQIPDGVIAVKPMPKAGWDLQTIAGPYSQAYDFHGASLTKGVKEVSWTGKLLDDNYEEFVFQAYLTGGLASETILYFPVVQECEGGKVHRWIEIPGPGKGARDYREPAPGLKLLPKATD